MNDMIVDTKFMMDKVGKPGWVFVDVRFAHDYAKGHIPGSVGLPAWVSKMFADDKKRQAAVIPLMERTLGEMGISNESHVIIYGAPANAHWNMVMFWILEAFGCNSTLMKGTVRFYDGGTVRWTAEGGTLDQAQEAIKPAKFKGVAGSKRGAKMDEMLRIIGGKKKAIVLDVRTPSEYDGTDVRALRGGRIPGAVNIDFMENLDLATFRMLPLDQLQGLYKFVPKDQRVITYCQTGQRAAYTYLVLRALGYKDVAVYHDGWRVYGSDLNLPVEDETWYDFSKIATTMEAVKNMKEKMISHIMMGEKH